MGKGKLEKFAEMETFPNVFQCPMSALGGEHHELRGKWGGKVFGNGNPIVLELGCSKGEYTVALAKRFPGRNFIGVDIKGARMWAGAKQALDEGVANAAFLRTNIEVVDRFFAPGEVAEIWLTFSDPQMKKPGKRLTSTFFMERYRRFLADGGAIHLKTDSNFLFTYTRIMAEKNGLGIAVESEDLHNDPSLPEETRALLSIRTYYESMWMDRGIPIKYMEFRLPAVGKLEEPNVEIPVDEYRSYRRDRRTGADTRV